MLLNNQIFLFFHGLANKSQLQNEAIFFIAETLPYIVVLSATAFLLFHHDILRIKSHPNKDDIWNSFKTFKQKWKEIILVFFSGISALLIATVLKYVIATQRPHLEFLNIYPLIYKMDYSFPSGHSTFFMAVAVAIFFSHKKAGYIFIFLALLIGLARITAGVHFPIDIAGGFVLGIIISCLVRFFYNKT
jgi:membrane-associated phospholipid phosphatase